MGGTVDLRGAAEPGANGGQPGQQRSLELHQRLFNHGGEPLAKRLQLAELVFAGQTQVPRPDHLLWEWWSQVALNKRTQAHREHGLWMLLGKMLQRAAQDRELARLVRPALQQVFIAVFEDPLADLADAERVRLWQAASACYADFSRLCQPRLREHVALASTLAAAVRRAPLSTALSRALDQLLALQESHANPKKMFSVLVQQLLPTLIGLRSWLSELPSDAAFEVAPTALVQQIDALVTLGLFHSAHLPLFRDGMTSTVPPHGLDLSSKPASGRILTYPHQLFDALRSMAESSPPDHAIVCSILPMLLASFCSATQNMFRPFTRRIQFCFFLELVQLLACGAQGMTWLGNPDAVKRKGAGSDPSVPHNRPASEAATASPCCTALARLLSTLDASRVYDEVDDRKHGSELQSWLSWLGGALSHRAATPSLSPAELDALAAALSALACLNHVFLEPHLRDNILRAIALDRPSWWDFARHSLAIHAELRQLDTVLTAVFAASRAWEAPTLASAALPAAFLSELGTCVQTLPQGQIPELARLVIEETQQTLAVLNMANLASSANGGSGSLPRGVLPACQLLSTFLCHACLSSHNMAVFAELLRSAEALIAEPLLALVGQLVETMGPAHADGQDVVMALLELLLGLGQAGFLHLQMEHSSCSTSPSTTTGAASSAKHWLPTVCHDGSLSAGLWARSAQLAAPVLSLLCRWDAQMLGHRQHLAWLQQSSDGRPKRLRREPDPLSARQFANLLHVLEADGRLALDTRATVWTTICEQLEMLDGLCSPAQRTSLAGQLLRSFTLPAERPLRTASVQLLQRPATYELRELGCAVRTAILSALALPGAADELAGVLQLVSLLPMCVWGADELAGLVRCLVGIVLEAEDGRWSLATPRTAPRGKLKLKRQPPRPAATDAAAASDEPHQLQCMCLALVWRAVESNCRAAWTGLVGTAGTDRPAGSGDGSGGSTLARIVRLALRPTLSTLVGQVLGALVRHAPRALEPAELAALAATVEASLLGAPGTEAALAQQPVLVQVVAAVLQASAAAAADAPRRRHSHAATSAFPRLATWLYQALDRALKADVAPCAETLAAGGSLFKYMTASAEAGADLPPGTLDSLVRRMLAHAGSSLPLLEALLCSPRPLAPSVFARLLATAFAASCRSSGAGACAADRASHVGAMLEGMASQLTAETLDMVCDFIASELRRATQDSPERAPSNVVTEVVGAADDADGAPQLGQGVRLLATLQLWTRIMAGRLAEERVHQLRRRVGELLGLLFRAVQVCGRLWPLGLAVPMAVAALEVTRACLGLGVAELSPRLGGFVLEAVATSSMLTGEAHGADFVDLFQTQARLLLFALQRHATAMLPNMAPLVAVLSGLLLALLREVASGTSTASEPSGRVAGASVSSGSFGVVSPLTSCAHTLSRVLELLATHKAAVSKHAPFLLAEYVRLQQAVEVPASLQAALEPGFFALLDTCSEHEVGVLHAVVSVAGKSVVKQLHQAYVKTHKFHGQV